MGIYPEKVFFNVAKSTSFSVVRSAHRWSREWLQTFR